MADSITMILSLCVMAFGAGILVRNPIHQQLIKLIEKNTETTEDLLEVLKISSDTIEELLKENTEWRTAYGKAAEKLEVFELIMDDDKELEREYNEWKKELAEAIN